MDPKILAVALLRRLGGDVIISDAELATAGEGDSVASANSGAVYGSIRRRAMSR